MSIIRMLSILALVAALQLYGEGRTEKTLELSIHYSDGLSSRSSSNQPPQIILFADHTQIHLAISNKSDREISLWKPFCPPGDDAISFEFKESKKSSKIMRARISMGYTGGMGFAKTMTLASNDTFIFNANFLKFWDFPFRIEKGKSKTIFIRAVYDSKASKSPSLENKGEDVWVGKVETKWEEVQIINRTNAAAP